MQMLWKFLSDSREFFVALLQISCWPKDSEIEQVTVGIVLLQISALYNYDCTLNNLNNTYLPQ